MSIERSKENVLLKIGESTAKRVALQKEKISMEAIQELWRQKMPKPKNFRGLFSSPGLHVIAEVKLASPSHGEIAAQLDPVSVARDYLSNGARALSILTEPEFFKGKLEYLEKIRAAFPDAYLLEKDFVVEPYQLFEAGLAGADAILLIVALLGEEKSKSLLMLAQSLGLTALVEVHDTEELAIATRIGADLIGINNRNLKDLSISLKVSEDLIPKCPKEAFVICESGLGTHEDLLKMRAVGCHGFLIGSSLMKTGTPGPALASLLHG